MLENNQLKLADGSKIDIITNACQKVSNKEKQMPVMQGKIGNNQVQTLRDTGCNRVVVKKAHVNEEDYNGKMGCMLLVDNTLRRAPMASMYVETPYYSGMVEAFVLPDAIYDLIIGNIKGARNPDNPDPNWTTNASVKTNQTELKI